MIWIIPVLVFAAGCLAVAVWALREMYHYKALAKDSDITDQMIEEHAQRQTRVEELLKENATLTAERDTNKLQSQIALAQLSDMGESLLTCIEERDALKLQLDEALEPKSPPATDGAVKKPPRTSRAKSGKGDRE